MIDFEDLANRGIFHTSTAAAKPAPGPSDALAERMVWAAKAAPELPDGIAPPEEAPNAAVAALRAADPARALYRDDLAYGGTPNNPGGSIRALAEAALPDALPEQREYMIKTAAAAFQDVGANRDDVERVTLAITAFRNNPPSDERVVEMRQEVERDLRAELGTGYAQALRDAQTLVSRDPRLKRLLDETGAGDAPAVIKTFVDLARVQRREGRLK